MPWPLHAVTRPSPRRRFSMHSRRLRNGGAPIALLALTVLAGFAPPADKQNSFTVHNPVSDQPGVPEHHEPNPVNARGRVGGAPRPRRGAAHERGVPTPYN